MTKQAHSDEVSQERLSAATLATMLPLCVTQHEEMLCINWCDVSDVPFSEPFYGQTQNHILGSNTRPIIRTSLQALNDIESLVPGRDPSAFIFHLSRCGSTLVTTLANQLPDVEGFSEPGALGVLLKALDKDVYTRDERIEYVRLLVRAFARARPDAKTFFIKCDLTPFEHHEVIRQAFPDTPWIFVYRDPREILASNIQKPANWLQRSSIPEGMRMIRGIPIEDAPSFESPQVAAKRLENDMRVALGNFCDRALMVDYHEFPSAVWARILPHMGRMPTAPEIHLMAEKSQWHSKFPGQKYVPDTGWKQNYLSLEINEIVESRLMPLYTALQVKRRGQH